jgi:hypothetical protein
MEQPELPEGVLAYQEYDVDLPDGARGCIAFTLDDLFASTHAAREIQRGGGKAFGIIAMRDIPDAPTGTVIWFLKDETVVLSIENGAHVTDRLNQIITRYLEKFFIELAPSFPWLAEELAGIGAVPDASRGS